MKPALPAHPRIGFVLDPIAGLNVKKDTSLAFVDAAQRRGWQPYYIEPAAMRLEGGLVRARMCTLNIDLDNSSWYRLGDLEDLPLSELDVLMMRKDPPFDMNYVYASYMLERAEQAGVVVVNRPASLRDCNEKLFATEFPQCCPPLIVSSDQAALKQFHTQHRDVIFKPLDGMGGASIFRAGPAEHNLNVILETLTEHGVRPIMAQTYLPEIVDGDKRILLIDGEPVDYCLARIPSVGESRGNLAAGGQGRVQELSVRDRWIAGQIGAELRRRGLIFVGLDVIGDFLTEINVTSPTCVREISRETGIDIAAQLLDAIESRFVNSGA